MPTGLNRSRTNDTASCKARSYLSGSFGKLHTYSIGVFHHVRVVGGTTKSEEFSTLEVPVRFAAGIRVRSSSTFLPATMWRRHPQATSHEGEPMRDSPWVCGLR